MASFPYQLPRPHTTHPASDPFILVGNTPHQQAMGSIGFHHPPYLPGYHPSSTANSPESITDVPATAAADKSRRCEEEVEITREKNKNKKHRLCHNSATPIVSEESKRGKQSKRRRLREAEENPSGFVHVRARRGQATDSHSLAERVRRERISERMRMLQGLVPGCEKVTGKALVLDEIINYVQSLQHQVEFLSMRIASLSPIVYGFGLDSGNHLVEPQKMDSTVPTAVPSKQGTCHLQPPDYAEAANDYSDMPSSGPVLLQVQGPPAYFQDISCYVKQDGEQGTRSAYSFQ